MRMQSVGFPPMVVLVGYNSIRCPGQSSVSGQPVASQTASKFVTFNGSDLLGVLEVKDNLLGFFAVQTFERLVWCALNRDECAVCLSDQLPSGICLGKLHLVSCDCLFSCGCCL